MSRLLAVAVIGIAGVIALFTLGIPFDNQPRPLTLSFVAHVDGAPLTFNDVKYPNPAGAGRFSITDFRFFISNVRLVGEDRSFAVPESYHLVRFGSGAAEYTVTIPEVPLGRIERIDFSLGVDEAANTSIESIGDLDPNSRMAWNWEIGYKFVLLEGSLRTDRGSIPLVYHVGFNENRRDYSFDLPEAERTGEGAGVSFAVDVMKLFSGSIPIDLASTPSIIMDRDDARKMADNYKTLISYGE